MNAFNAFKWIFAALAALAGLACGCKTSAPDIMQTREMKALEAGWGSPIGLKLIFGIEEKNAPGAASLKGKDGFLVTADNAKTAQALSRTMSRGGWFHAADVLEDGRESRIEERQAGDRVLREARRTGSARHHFMARARDARADFLVLLRADPVEVVFDGANKSLPWTLLVWSLFIPPTWWIPDETYSGRFNVTAEVIGVSAPFEGRESSLVFTRRITRHLNDLDRGLGWIDLTPLPASGSESSCRSAASFLYSWFMCEFVPELLSRLGSHLEEEIALAKKRAEERERAKAEAAAEAVRFAAEAAARLNAPFIRPSEPDKPKPPDPRGFAVFAGVDCYADPAPAGTSFCANDAARMHAVFSGVFPFSSGENIVLLTGAKASRTAIEGAINRIVQAAPRAGDCIAVFLSGAGIAARDPGARPEIFFKACPAKGESGDDRLPVGELFERLAATEASKIVVMLDFAFASRGLRSFGAPDPLVVHEAVARLRSAAERRSGFFLLMAEDGTGEAVELKALESGLFTDSLAAALKAGENRLDRIAERVGARVREEADKRALAQNPLFAGDTARTLR